MNAQACSRCHRMFLEGCEEWADIRAVGQGLGKPLLWLCPGCYRHQEVKTHELYHVKHKCGHSAFWENSMVAQLTKKQPCPWCGGEEGAAYHPKHPYLDFGPPFGRVLRSTRVRGPGDPEEALVHHYPDDSCCKGVEVGTGVSD